MAFDFYEFRSEANRKLNSQKWFTVLQDYGQNLNKPFMVDQIDLDRLTTNSYQNWYNTNHKAYQVDTKIISSIKNELATHKILIFMGTWYGDSKREVLRFIKVLEATGFPMENLKIVAVDQRKIKKKPHRRRMVTTHQTRAYFYFL